MSDITHDNKEDLVITEQLRLASARTGRPIVSVTCLDKADGLHVKFLTLVPSVPVRGDALMLQDGKWAMVSSVRHKVIKLKDEQGREYFDLQTDVAAIYDKNAQPNFET